MNAFNAHQLAFALPVGLLACFFGLLVSFPVGYNLVSPDKGCAADQVMWWSTFWPNITVVGAGIATICWGIGVRRSSRLPVGSLGGALVIDGLLLNFPFPVVFWQRWGNLPYYATTCLANGCPQLTAGQWWSIFWPGLAAGVAGVCLIIAGSALVLVSRRPIRKRTWVPATLLVLVVCAGLIALQI